MQKSTRALSGVAAFVVVWAGQIVSVLATQMTHFALTLWAYEKTGSATALGLVSVFSVTPLLIMSPFAGAMVDRYNRRLMMMVSDLGAGLATVSILVLQANGLLDVWHLYAASAVTGLCQAFQWPAYSAAISLMVPKEHYGRANGMMSLVETGPWVLAPLLSAGLLGVIGLRGILLIDVATFVLAIGALLVVHVPQPPASSKGREAGAGLREQATYGIRYLLRRRSLLGLQLVFLGGNFFVTMAAALVAPMVLARTGSNEALLGIVFSAGAVGSLLGGIVMSAWGGFRRQVHGVLLGWILACLLGVMLLGAGRDALIWIPAMFIFSALVPLIDSSNQSIWQAKVAPEVQGRVFSTRQLIAGFMTPIAPLIAGPLADFVLEPGMQSGGRLTGLFSWLTGTGPGAGMALWILACGLAGACIGLAGYLSPAVRNVEDLLPDHSTDQETA